MECLIKQPKEKTIKQTYKRYQKTKQQQNNLSHDLDCFLKNRYM